MPIFEYRCKQCGEVFERLVRAAGEAVACPACASRSVAKLLSVPSAPRASSAGAPVAGGGGGCCGGGGCSCHN